TYPGTARSPARRDRRAWRSPADRSWAGAVAGPSGPSSRTAVRCAGLSLLLIAPTPRYGLAAGFTAVVAAGATRQSPTRPRRDSTVPAPGPGLGTRPRRREKAGSAGGAQYDVDFGTPGPYRCRPAPCRLRCPRPGRP